LDLINEQYERYRSVRQDAVYHYGWAKSRGDYSESRSHENHVMEIDKKLEFLELSGNEKITMEDLKPLASLPLREIGVTGCVAGAEEFRDAIFGTFAQLEALDGMDREGNEIESEDEDLEDLDDDEYEEEDEDDEDGDEDEDEDGDDEDDDDDDDDEEEEGDEEEEEEGDEEEPAEEEGDDAADGKRKADEANGAPAKKAKTG